VQIHDDDLGVAELRLLARVEPSAGSPTTVMSGTEVMSARNPSRMSG
jgi:hypothetical protein